MIYGGYTDLKATKVGSLALLVPFISLVVGAIIGEALRIEQRLEGLVGRLERRLSKKAAKVDANSDVVTDVRPSFVEGFMTASLLYCVGAITVLGSIKAGLGDPSLLYMKSLMDGIASIALACALGIGVGFSAVSVLVIQGGIALLAMSLGGFFTPPILAAIDLVGGILVLAISFDLIGVKKLRVGNMLPGLLIAIFLGWVLGR